MADAIFAEKGYRVLPGALPAALLGHVRQITAPLVSQSQRGEMTERDGFAVGTSSWYGHPPLDGILDFLRPAIERAVGDPLLPTYSFARCYPRGTTLTRHRDRPSCEVSVTLPVAGSDDATWPIYLGTADETLAKVDLVHGDALVYSGIDLWHWREPLEADWRLQLFLHYVRRDGPNAEWQFDKRARLGDPPVAGMPDS
jgi:hypothetical protein